MLLGELLEQLPFPGSGDYGCIGLKLTGEVRELVFLCRRRRAELLIKEEE